MLRLFFPHSGVALILQQEKQGEWVIAAGLLHDTIEDTSKKQKRFIDVVLAIENGVLRV